MTDTELRRLMVAAINEGRPVCYRMTISGNGISPNGDGAVIVENVVRPVRTPAPWPLIVVGFAAGCVVGGALRWLR